MTRYQLTTEKSWHQTLQDLEETFRKWRGVTTWQVTPNVRGAAAYRQLEKQHQTTEQRTVLLDYTLHGTLVTLTMDKQSRAVDNLRVLYLAVEAMRLNEARGIGDVMREAYLQLPAPAILTLYQILGIDATAPLAVIEAHYRRMAKQVHPDSPTGDAERFKSITEAMAHIRKERTG